MTTAPRTTVVTIGAYPLNEVHVRLSRLLHSAAEYEIPVRILFAGESYGSHSRSKVRRLLEVIRREVTTPRVLYVDGADSIFVRDLDAIDDELDALGAEVLVSAEAECWPHWTHDPDWPTRFPPAPPGGLRYPNAGQWMGETRAVVGALEVLDGIYQRCLDYWADFYKHGNRPERDRRDRFPELVVRPRWAPIAAVGAELDQFLWHLAWLNGRIAFSLDAHSRIFRNMGVAGDELPEVGTAALLHFSGPIGRAQLARWDLGRDGTA